MADLESFAFGDSPALADELLALVLIGRKTATCWAAAEGDKGVVVGKRWIVNDGQGRSRAVIETVELERRRFEEVGEGFAFDEGEGDRSFLVAGRAYGLFQPARRVCPGDGGLLRAVQACGSALRAKPSSGASRHLLPGRRGHPSTISERAVLAAVYSS